MAMFSLSDAFIAQPKVSAAKTIFSAATETSMDTPEILPEFPNKDEYLTYMETVSALPKGFASGTANGKFVSVEAPALGPLPIRATVIYLTEGPTENWAAVFTKNKASNGDSLLKDRRQQGLCSLFWITSMSICTLHSITHSPCILTSKSTVPWSSGDCRQEAYRRRRTVTCNRD